MPSSPSLLHRCDEIHRQQKASADRSQRLAAVVDAIRAAGGSPTFAAEVVKSLESSNASSESHKETGLCSTTGCARKLSPRNYTSGTCTECWLKAAIVRW